MLKNGLYNVLGAVIRIGLSTLTIPLLIRLIGIEEYGVWTLASTMVGIVGLAEAGLSVSTTVFLSRDLANKDVDGISQTLTVALGTMLLLATSAAICLLIIAPELVELLPRLPQSQHSPIVKALQVGAVVVWTQLLQRVFIGVEQAYQKYALINIINTIQIVFINFGMLVVAWLGGKTEELMQWHAVTSIGILIAHCLVVWLLFRGMKIRPTWDRNKGLTIAKYSLTTWLGSLGGALFSRVDRILVGASLGTTLLGVYAAITNITVQINSLSALAIQPLLPAISKQTAQGKFDKLVLQRQVKQSLEINCVFALGTGAILMALAPQVVEVMIPGKYTAAYTLAFYFATVIYSFYSLNAVGYYILLGLGFARSFTAIQFISGSISLIFITIGSYNFGLLGATVGNAGYLFVWLLTFFAMKKLTIRTKLWLHWLKVPVAWFLLITFISIISPDSLVYRVLILVVQVIIVLAWFNSVRGINLQDLIQSLTKKC